MKTALLFDHFGPYHKARLLAAAGLMKVTGVELHALSKDYAWKPSYQHGLPLVSLAQFGGHGRGSPRRATIETLEITLSSLNPDVVAIPGWSAPESLAALQWCLQKKVPAILMSESCAHDEARTGWKEQIKRHMVACFSTALVGGRLHQAYLQELRMKTDRIFLGYDAVDNEFFSRSEAEIKPAQSPSRLSSVPAQCFMASARFISKKNLPVLLRAYASYRQMADPAWDLILLGDGPMRHEIEEQVKEFHLEGSVSLPGFKQYEELPGYYAQATVFIHASTTEQWGLVVNEAMASGLPVLVSDRCGCAPDLVRDGVNGFCFDPFDPEALAYLMLRMSSMPPAELEKMSRASEEIISHWGPERFAQGLMAAAEAALAAPKPSAGLMDQALLKLLCLR